MTDYSNWEIVGDAPHQDYSNWEIVEKANNKQNIVPEQQEPQGFGEHFAQALQENPVRKFAESTGIPQFAAGGIESLGNLGISVGNVPVNLISKAFGEDYKIPHLDFGQYFDEPGWLYQGGKIAGGFLPVAKGIGAAREVLRPKGYMGILSDALKGMGIGYATGETSEGDRTAGTIFGTLLGSLGGMGSKATGKRMEKNIKEGKNLLGQEYKGLFEEIKDSGIDKLRKPNINIEKIKNNSLPEYYENLEKFIKNKNPNFEEAHWAQSDLGKLINKWSKDFKAGKMTSSEIQAYKEAIDAQKRIRGSMFTGLTNKGRSDLAKEYGELTSEFEEFMGTHGSKETQKLISQLLGNERQEQFISGTYPEIRANDLAKNLAKIGITGTAGYGAYKGIQEAMK